MLSALEHIHSYNSGGKIHRSLVAFIILYANTNHLPYFWLTNESLAHYLGAPVECVSMVSCKACPSTKLCPSYHASIRLSGHLEGLRRASILAAMVVAIGRPALPKPELSGRIRSTCPARCPIFLCHKADGLQYIRASGKGRV